MLLQQAGPAIQRFCNPCLFLSSAAGYILGAAAVMHGYGETSCGRISAQIHAVLKIEHRLMFPATLEDDDAQAVRLCSTAVRGLEVSTLYKD